MWYGVFLALIVAAVDWWAWGWDRRLGGWLPVWVAYGILVQLLLAAALWQFGERVWEPLAQADEEWLAGHQQAPGPKAEGEGWLPPPEVLSASGREGEGRP